MKDVITNPKKHISDLKKIITEIVSRGLSSSEEPPVDHYHADGLYGRRIYVPAGTTVITKVHLTQHITVALKGTCTVFDEKGHRKTVSAPNVFVTEKGTCRAVYCHDDVEWLTVHSCELKTITEIEHAIGCEDFAEYDDRQDYKLFLTEMGMTEELARSISESTDDQTNDVESISKIYIDKSSLQGLGVFARQDFLEGDEIGIAKIGNLRTMIGRYANHSKNANCTFKLCDNLVKVIANKAISQNSEITFDYREVFAIIKNMRALT